METLKYAGPVAGTLGISMADLSVAIGLMGNAGIKGSQAGTALRGGLTNLVKPTDDMAAAMKKYGVELVKNDDGSVNLMNTMKLMRTNLGELDQATQAQALATIFGKEAMSGWASVVNASDKDFEKLTQAIANSEGKANEMATVMQDNLQGALTNLGSAVEGAAISIGEALLPLIKELTSWIQGAVDWFNSLDSSTQTLIVSVGLFVAVLGPLLMIIGSLISAITTIGGALSGLAGMFGLTSGAAAGTTGALAGASGAAAGTTGALGGLLGAGTTLASFLTGGLIFALVGVIAKVGESEVALSWLQEKFGSLGVIVGAVCEFISGIWTITIDNMISIVKFGLDTIASIIDGPGGKTIEDSFKKHQEEVQKNTEEAWKKLTLTTTRELSQQKNSVDTETKDAANKADANTKDMANKVGQNAKQAKDEMQKNMSATSKVVFDESGKIPKDVQSNMSKSVQAMRQAGSDIYNGMNTSFSKLASQGKQHFSDLYNGVTRSTSKMASQVIADWNRIRSSLSQSITGNVNIKVHGVQAALNQINSVKNAARHRSFASFAAMPRSYEDNTRRSFMASSPFMSFAAMPITPTRAYTQTYDVLKSNDIASFVSSQIPSSINVKLGTEESKKKKSSPSIQNVNVNVNIDNFENKTSDSPREFADKVIDRVVYKLKREKLATGGA